MVPSVPFSNVFFKNATYFAPSKVVLELEAIRYKLRPRFVLFEYLSDFANCSDLRPGCPDLSGGVLGSNLPISRVNLARYFGSNLSISPSLRPSFLSWTFVRQPQRGPLLKF